MSYKEQRQAEYTDIDYQYKMKLKYMCNLCEHYERGKGCRLKECDKKLYDH